MCRMTRFQMRHDRARYSLTAKALNYTATLPVFDADGIKLNRAGCFWHLSAHRQSGVFPVTCHVDVA
jgi:hypothetical protein